MHINPLSTYSIQVSLKGSTESITTLEVTSSDTSVMTASVDDFASDGNPYLRISPKKSGVARLTISARNSASGHSATTHITFKVVNNGDLIDVISGTIDPLSENGDISLKGKYFNTISFKVKDEYKDYFDLAYDSRNTGSDVAVTIQGNVVTIENISLGSSIPQCHVQLRKKADYVYLIAGVLTYFEIDENEDYHVTDADMRLAGNYAVIYPGDGESLTASLADFQTNNVHAMYNITPSLISRARNVEISAESGDASVAEILQETEGYGKRRDIAVKVLATGVSELTLRTRDNLGFEKVAHITLIVTE